MAGGVGQGQSRPRGQILDAALALPEMLEQSGFVDIRIGPSVDTFGGAGGESKARLFEVYGYAFLAHKPK